MSADTDVIDLADRLNVRTEREKTMDVNLRDAFRNLGPLIADLPSAETFLLAPGALVSWRVVRDVDPEAYLVYLSAVRMKCGANIALLVSNLVGPPGTGVAGSLRDIELLTPAELSARAAPLDLIRGVLPAKGNAVIFGETGSGKTFCVFDLALAVARGVRWFGRRVRRGGVVYIAAEGAMKGRLEAYARHHGIELDDVPIRIIEQPIRLRGGMQDTARLIESIKAAEVELGGIALIVLDTFNRTFAGGNENGSDDVGEYLDSIGRITDEFGCLCLIVHHSGKNAAAGARGHSSLKGNLDAEIEVTVDASGIRTATITKARDGADGDTFSFRLDAIDLGPHPDPEAEEGERWGSCVVAPLNYTPARVAKKQKLTGDEEIALRTLRELAEVSNQRLPETSTVPIGVTHAVKVEDWRERFYNRLGGERDTDRDAKRQAFLRGRKGLVSKGYCGMQDVWVWAVTQRDAP